MSRAKAAMLTLVLLLLGIDVSAHRIDEYLQATLLSVGADRIQASMRLIPGELVAASVIASIDANSDGVFSEAEQQAYAERVLGDLSITADAHAVQPKLVSWSFPAPAQMRAGLGETHIEYNVELPPGRGDRSFIVANRHQADRSVYLVNALVPESPGLRILAQKRDRRQSLYELDYRQEGIATPGARSPLASASQWWEGLQLSSLFRLGTRHIAEGTDHLLFLLALLLPAPLRALGTRWDTPASVRRSLLRVLGIVTAFTLGHTFTLSLAALGGLNIPSRPVEVLIAVSILVSAVHALRPIFPGKEAVIAAAFGLVHGLAFAASLDRLGLGLWDRVAGTLAFNLGIEAMQLLVVAAVLPSLLLASRTAVYSMLRMAGAVFAGAASLAWIVERLLGTDTRIDRLVDALAWHAPAIAVAFLLVSLAAFCAPSRRILPDRSRASATSMMR